MEKPRTMISAAVLTGHPALPRQRASKKRRGIIKKIKPRTKSAQIAQRADRLFDIWASSKEPPKEHDPDAPTIWKGDRVPRLGQGVRPDIPAVKVDAPGCSFNPDPVQHQAVLEEEEKRELRRMKPPSAVAESNVLQQETLLDELEQFNMMTKESEEEEETVAAVVHRPRIPERKTKAQRNKQERHRKYMKGIEERKKIKKLYSQISNVKQLNKSISQKLKQQHLNNLARKAKKEAEKKDGLRRLGPKPIPDIPTAVQSADGVATRLRRLQVSNDLALDRYVSLQKRGMIETGRFRGRKNRKRYKYQNIAAQRQRQEEAKVEIPVLQQRVQELHNQLQQVKLTEAAT